MNRYAFGAALLMGGAALAVDPSVRRENERTAAAPSGAAAIGAIRESRSTLSTGIARAAREGFWSSSTPAAHHTLGRAAHTPTPKSLPKEATAAPDAPTRDTATLSADGERGFVQLLPPPPDTAADAAESSSIESRYFELPPAPES